MGALIRDNIPLDIASDTSIYVLGVNGSVLAALAAEDGVAFRDMRSKTLLGLCFLDTDDFGVERVFGRSVDASQSSKGDSGLKVVRALQNIGQESIKDDAEDGCVSAMRVFLQSK